MQSAAAMSEPVETAGQIVATAASLLAGAGISTARLDAEVLLAHACGGERATLYANWQRNISTGSYARFAALLRRRLAREPLQYIVGRQEFWSLDFTVTPDVLIPRPETELLVELAVELTAPIEAEPWRQSDNVVVRRNSIAAARPGRRRGMNSPAKSQQSRLRGTPRSETESASADLERLSPGILFPGDRSEPSLAPSRARTLNGKAPVICDVGTGSGCVAAALAHELPEADIWALDISAAALTVAQGNAYRLGVAERIRFSQSDLLSAAAARRFDVIVSNPPYVCCEELRDPQPELRWEPLRALDGGAAGLDIITRLVTEAHTCLKPGGWLIMEIGGGQSGAVSELAREAGFGSVSIESDYAGLPRALLACR